MQEAKYIAIDTETGGIGSDVSLLELYCGFYDKNFSKLGEFEVKTKPDNKIYSVTSQALAINKIDLIKHEKEAFTYAAAGTQLYHQLQEWSQGGKIKLIPIGHNVKFDVIKITDNLMKEGTWLKFVSYRTMDTGPIGQFLTTVGVISPDVSGSLNSLREFFNIKLNGQLHTARTDAELTVEILKKMIEATANLNMPRREIDEE